MRTPTANRRKQKQIADLLREGKTQEARRLLTAIAGAPQPPVWALQMLSAACGRLGDFAASEAAARRCLEVSPRDVNAWHNLGLAMTRQARPTEAVQAFEQALAIDARHIESRYSLGLALNDLGQLGAAAAALAALLEIKPEHAWANFTLGTIYCEAGERDKGVACLARAAAIDPQLREKTAYFIDGVTARQPRTNAAIEHVRILFDKHAATFDTHLKALGYDVPALLAARIRAAARPAKLDVLDLGCGTGLCGNALRDIAGRLTGVDIAPRMIEAARARGIYDELEVNDLLAALRARRQAVDLVIAADVFIYVGDLSAIFPAVREALCDAGLFAFSVESAADGEVTLRASGRYAHSNEYLLRLAATHRMRVELAEATTIRLEQQRPIAGHIYLLRRTD